MPRPRLCRRVCCEPCFIYFKPAGIRMIDLEESILTVDEFEAVRWKDWEGLEQEAAAERMGISQPTFHRMLSSARRKIADALVNGKAIRIEGGFFKTAGPRKSQCPKCGHGWEIPQGAGRQPDCPRCRHASIHRAEDVRERAGKGSGPRRRNPLDHKEKT